MGVHASHAEGVVGDSMAMLAKSYWPRARRYYSDGSGLVGFHTGPLEAGMPIVWCRPGDEPGAWETTGSTLTSEGAEKVTF